MLTLFTRRKKILASFMQRRKVSDHLCGEEKFPIIYAAKKSFRSIMQRRKVSDHLCSKEKFPIIYAAKKSFRSFMRRRKVCSNMAITFSAKNILCWEFRVLFDLGLTPYSTPNDFGLTHVSPLFHPFFTPESPNYTKLRHFECCLTSDWPWTHLKTTLGSPSSL